VTWRTEACTALHETQGGACGTAQAEDVGVLLAEAIGTVIEGRLKRDAVGELPSLACVDIMSLASAFCSALNLSVPMHHTISVRISSRIAAVSVGRVTRLHQAAAPSAGAQWRCRWT
jgi:hypothetical protein